MAPSGLITNAGKTFKARLLAGEVLGGLGWMALGDGTWDDKASPPAEDAAQTGLTHEVLRKRIDRFAYLVQDDLAGTIPFQGHLYSESETPTPVLAYFATFNEEEAVGLSICEEGLFGGPVITSESPLALASEVLNPGILYWVRNRGLYTKGSDDTFEVVATFRED